MRRYAALVLAALVPFLAAGRYPAETKPELCTPKNPYIAQEPTAFASLGIKDAWKITQGQGVTVAVVDSGVNRSNPHFAGGVLLDTVDLMDKGRPPAANGGDDHGTQMAGQIAAQKIPESGVVGVAPRAKILPVRVFDGRDEPGQDPGRDERMAKGIAAAADRGAKIISVSMSNTKGSAVLQQAVAHARSRGALVVASGGNVREDSEDANAPRYPAAFPGAIGVTAVDEHGEAASSVIHGVTVKIAAPGQKVYSTYRDFGDCAFEEQPASSPATAYVAGIAALVASAHPDEGPDMWAYRLMVTASRTQADVQTPTLGWGIVSPVAALTFVDDGQALGPLHPSGNRPPARSAQVSRLEPVGDLIADRRGAWLLGGGVVTASLLVAILLARMLLRR